MAALHLNTIIRHISIRNAEHIPITFARAQRYENRTHTHGKRHETHGVSAFPFAFTGSSWCWSWSSSSLSASLKVALHLIGSQPHPSASRPVYIAIKDIQPLVTTIRLPGFRGCSGLSSGGREAGGEDSVGLEPASSRKRSDWLKLSMQRTSSLPLNVISSSHKKPTLRRICRHAALNGYISLP